MKCKHCDGDGVIVDVEYGHAGKYGCKYCDGKGVVEPLTEQEYLQTCTTEELAGAIYAWYSQGHIEGKVGKHLSSVTRVVDWLKEIHHAE